MGERKWVQSSSGYLELIDAETGEVIEREKKPSAPKVVRSGGRGPGRPSLNEIEESRANRPRRERRLYPYDPVVAQMICDWVSEGGWLTRPDPDLQFPPYSEIIRWQRENPDFAHRLTQAKLARAPYFEERAIQAGLSAEHKNEVPAARLKFDALTKAAEWADPSRYNKKILGIEHQRPYVVRIVTGVPPPDGTPPDTRTDEEFVDDWMKDKESQK